MQGDFTRSTFRPQKAYASVRMQQGRVQLDADWNEAEDIRLHLARTGHRDTIGPAGAPKTGGGFEIGIAPGGSDLTIGEGRLYVEGVLCELSHDPVAVESFQKDRAVVAALVADGRPFVAHEWVELSAGSGPAHVARITTVDTDKRMMRFAPPLAETDVDAMKAAGPARLRRVLSYTTQPDLPSPPNVTSGNAAPALDLSNGAYLVYADVWERHVSALDDPDLIESALGGPDTATRTKVVGQVRLARLEGSGIDTCRDAPHPRDLPASAGGRAATTGRLRARATPQQASADPCILPANAGYRRLENQLYRVEVHAGGTRDEATFKWSRDNGSVASRWLGQVGNHVRVDSVGKDEVLGFSSAQFVELLDDTRELSGTPGVLVRIDAPPEGDKLPLDPAATFDRADFPVNPKLRRWDSEGAVAMDPAGDGWIALEDGVEVRFDEGTYNTGDYWLIPARTAIADVEWPRDAAGNPASRPPEGIEHRHAPLALLRVKTGAITLLDDCRDRFPSLTELTAADVDYDNSTCGLAGADTVQDALDLLCEEHTLRRHKRHLHGWGIVDGLQVVCGPDKEGEQRRAVTVRDGYAIDAEGNDVVLSKNRKLDVVEMIESLEKESEKPVLDDGDGEVALFFGLDPDRGNLRFDLERYDPHAGDDPEALLAGTLLWDFYEECVRPIERFLREELEAGDDGAPRPRRRTSRTTKEITGRRSVLSTLVAQFLNQRNGALIYVSDAEDAVLRDFYTRLRELLRSETFCALFDSARPFPDYPLADVPMGTIFGRGNHTRIRLRPGGAEAYTVGPGLNLKRPGTTINRYDLKKRALVAQVDPIAGSEAPASAGTDAVRDVAFSPDGKRIFMIAPTRTGKDTLFRAGTISDKGISWGRMETICGVRLVTLGTTAADAKSVYAIGVGSGLYKIVPDAVDTSPTPVTSFAASGQMRLTATGECVALGSSGSVLAGRYDTVFGYRVPTGDALFSPIALGETGEDDLAVVTRPAGDKGGAVYVVSGTGDKRLRVFAGDGKPVKSGSTPVSVPLGRTPVTLGVYEPGGVLLVGLEDSYAVRLLDLSTNAPVPQAIIPAQVGPVSIATDVDGRSAYVLNDVSDTITIVDGSLLTPGVRFPYQHLAAYRTAILEAFVDLTGGFLQYLKDCLCDHFLVRGPEPTGKEKLYLACVSVRGNQVYKVCNFSRRRYVKSFPTVSYWLSAVPIAPVFDRLFEEFCCMILPDKFGRFSAATFDEAGLDELGGGGGVRASSLRRGATTIQDLDPMKWVEQLMAKLRLAMMQAMSGFGGSKFGSQSPPPPPPPSPSSPSKPSEPPSGRPPSDYVLDKPVHDAITELGEKGYVVEHRPYEPGKDILGIVRGETRPPGPDERVILYEEGNQVRGVSIVSKEQPILGEVTQPVTEAVVAAERLTGEEALVAKTEVVEMAKRLEVMETELQKLRVLSEGSGTPTTRTSRTRTTPEKPT
ncbi:MAG TPA: DUF6519 domain-containing protein [Actinomycetota bacterium]